jgi:hypothetical protein
VKTLAGQRPAGTVLYGADRAEYTRLAAGPISATLDGGNLRWISCEGREVVRAIQLTARDGAWQTLVPEVRHRRVRQVADGFTVAFDARFRGASFDAACRVSLAADAAGVLTARMSVSFLGETISQRIGFVVLQPADLAGQPFSLPGVVPPVERLFPVDVVHERLATDVARLAWRPDDVTSAMIDFEGDLWEVEDQRNWTDDSFKAYCPPLSWPHPVVHPAGSSLEHRLTLRVERPKDRRPPAAVRAVGSRRLAAPSGISVSTEAFATVPPIGFGWCAPPSSDELAALTRLRPAHLRALVDLASDSWRADLDAAAATCRQVGCQLELEVLDDGTAPRATALAQSIAGLGGLVGAILSFDSSDPYQSLTSSERLVAETRATMAWAGCRVSVGGGSRANFAELNDPAVPVASLDTVAFSVTPQIHAFDDATILENLRTIPTLMRAAAGLAAGRPLDVFCTFRPRFNAYASPPDRSLSETRYDDRLATPLGAAWLVGSLAGLLARDLGRLTILDATGRAGVTSGPGSHATSRLGEILLAVTEPASGELLRVDTDAWHPALALRSGANLRVIVANLASRTTRATLQLPFDAMSVTRILGSRSSPAAVPPVAAPAAPTHSGSQVGLELEALACVIVDVRPARM